MRRYVLATTSQPAAKSVSLSGQNSLNLVTAIWNGVLLAFVISGQVNKGGVDVSKKSLVLFLLTFGRGVSAATA